MKKQDPNEYLNFKQIKAETDVAFMLNEFGLGDQITLKPGTNEMVGRCPLGKPGHGDETSFSFNTEKKTYQCFACKARGSVLDFYKEWHKVEHPDDATLDLREAAFALYHMIERQQAAAEKQEPEPQLAEVKKFKKPMRYTMPEIKPAQAADSAVSDLKLSQEEIDEQAINAGVAALERKMERLKDQFFIESLDDSKQIAALRLGILKHECMAMILVTRKHKLIEFVELGNGTPANANFNFNYMIRKIVESSASGVILCHNHPSGESQPSSADIAITKEAQEVLQLIQVSLLDHVIVGSDVFSMKQEGII